MPARCGCRDDLVAGRYGGPVSGRGGARPAAGGGRWVDVDPERLNRWLDGFVQRHGAPETEDGLVITGADGVTAELFPPPGAGPVATIDELIAEARLPRRIGLLLARRGALGVATAFGADIEVSKVETSYVQGRTAAGGWSQQRYARRRGNQATAAVEKAVEITHRVLLPAVDRLSALVCGGDRATVGAILAEPRLAPLARVRSERFLEVAEPRYAVLEEAATAARRVRVRLSD